ncbi:MAG: minichromosome maintenance protein MCM [Thermofilum sp.]
MEKLETVDPRQAFEEILSSEKYFARISEMAVHGRSSFILDFDDVLGYSVELARALVENPDELLKHASNAAKQRLRIIDPSYAERLEAVAVRLSSLPEATPMREIGARHINKLIMVEGIVVRATPVQPMVVRATFRCKACGEVTPAPQEGAFLKQPYRCRNPDCHKTGKFEFVETLSEYIDSQSLRIQELPEELPPGQIPTYLDAIATGSDLTGIARPGDQVRVVGIVRATATVAPKAGRLRTMKVNLEVNNIVPASRSEMLNITPEDEAKIKELAMDPRIHEKLIQSIAPSMYGNEHIKEACLYLLFGGVPKRLHDINIRGDIHVLIVGDPSTFKSQLLQYAARVAPRGVYTSGRGTTAAGLTAAVVRTEQEGLTLEAGAMVLADRGIVAIDEFEKLRPEDRSAIHTAMEQQIVPVAKGGIVATLNARTAVLAAANPQFGRYEPARSVIENINLPVTILSRFDLIFILRDVPDREADARVSRHVLGLHRTRGAAVQPPISQDLLRKYIAYAKSINPVLTPEAEERLHQFYLKMREMSGEGGSIAITLRQLESLVRIAEARARAALRAEVTAEDAEAAIAIVSRFLRDVGMDVETMKPDVDMIMTGKPKSLRDKMAAILDIIAELQRETGMAEADLVYDEAARRLGLQKEEVQRVLAQLQREGVIYEPRAGYLRKT